MLQVVLKLTEPWSQKGHIPGQRTLAHAGAFDDHIAPDANLQRAMSEVAMTLAEPWSQKGHIPGQRTLASSNVFKDQDLTTPGFGFLQQAMVTMSLKLTTSISHAGVLAHAGLHYTEAPDTSNIMQTAVKPVFGNHPLSGRLQRALTS